MRILQVVHGFPPAASAGTEVYTRSLALALAQCADDEVRVFTRDADPYRAELTVRERTDGPLRVTAVNNTFQSCLSFEDSYANDGVERIAAAFLDEWPPDVVHIQHLTCLSTGIPRSAALRGIPVVMTLNDYWLICHRGQLVNLPGARCEGPFAGGCAGCIEPAALVNESAVRAGRTIRSLIVPGAAAAVQAAVDAVSTVLPARSTRTASLDRLRHMQAAVSRVDLFLAPSDTLLSKFLEFGIPRERLVRCDQGIASASNRPPLKLRRSAEALARAEEPALRSPSVPLRIAFAGGLQPSKGLHVLLEAIEKLPGASVTLDVFGSAAAYHGDIHYSSSLASRLGHPAVRRLGPVPHERMAARFADVDVLVVPSIWIENAPFIIREAFAAGVPVVASNLGGMAEMVRHEENGLLFTPGDAVDLAAQLRRLLDEPGLRESLRSGIRRPLSIEEDAARLRQIYSSLVKAGLKAGATGHAPVVSTFRSTITFRSAISAVVLNYQTPEQTCIAVQSLQSSRTRPDDIEVVDNGSGDQSVDMLRQALTGVRISPLPRNLGFSAGCNAGIRAALDRGSDWVLLVNSDAVLPPDAIEALIAAVNGDPNTGIVAPVLLSREEPDRIASAGIAFSTRTGRMRHRGAGRRIGSLEPGSRQVVDAVSGCVMLIRREVFETAGFFDERYFFSFEDVEFCLRARAAGFKTVCAQNAIAYHEGGRTIGRRSPRRVYFATRNHLRLAAEAGSPSGRTLRAGCVLGLNAAYVLVSPEAPLVGGLAAFVRGACHHFAGRYGPD
jgi:GT2 family glycosyltransferase/glycosyltransferase involved in cell wall biosynthesis